MAISASVLPSSTLPVRHSSTCYNFRSGEQTDNDKTRNMYKVSGSSHSRGAQPSRPPTKHGLQVAQQVVSYMQSDHEEKYHIDMNGGFVNH